MKTFIILLFAFTTINTFAYIPKFSTISNKVARNRSKTPIKVVQNITVKDKLSEITYKIQETLYIKNGDEIKIKVEGKDLLQGQVKTGYIYNSSRRFNFNGSSISQSNTSSSFYLPLMYTKTPGGFKKYMINKGMVPVQDTSTGLIQSKQYTKETFTHLSRTNGDVSYAITKKLSTKSLINPTLWVSTNGFHVNKIRLDQNGVIQLLGYKKYNKSIYHPSLQKIKWQNFEYNIQTVSVTPLSMSQVTRELAQSSLQASGDLNNFKSEALETFYSTFR